MWFMIYKAVYLKLSSTKWKKQGKSISYSTYAGTKQ